MFYKYGPTAPEVKIYNPRNVAQFDIADQPRNNLSSTFSKMTVDKHPVNLSFEKLLVRPRSHSVGARPGKCGAMF
ncbi:hypothetical protein K7432_016001 [Basidiobolus ranarum]|uniref:Uncharacterized protein n=1 Tax=Basidiobolus ranarum TaxID=34480 RepID=A0ABR2VNA8_9FUNG